MLWLVVLMVLSVHKLVNILVGVKMARLLRVNARVGEHVSVACERMAGMAVDGCEVECDFNGITLTACEGMTAKELEAQYYAKSQARRVEYEQSPEYKAQLERDAKELEELNAKAVVLMARLEAMNWGSLREVLDWCAEVQPVADRIGVQMDKKRVVALFNEHGFEANVNCEEDYKENDAENVARYIIGQALDGFKRVGAPHGALIHFVQKWRKKFGKV